MEEIEQFIRKTLAKIGINQNLIKDMNMSLQELGLNSIEFVALAMEINKRFGVKLELDVSENKSLHELCCIIWNDAKGVNKEANMNYKSIPAQFNVSQYLLEECNLKNGRGKKVAIYFKNKNYTYQEVNERVNQFANFLNTLGCQRNDNIMMYMGNYPEFVFLFLGAVKAGVIPVIVNSRMSKSEIDQIVKSTEAVEVFTDRNLVNNLSVSFIRKDYQLIEEVKELVNLESAEYKEALTYKDDPAFIIFTSGSSGVPKGVIHKHSSIVTIVETYGRFTLRTQSSDIFYAYSKLSYALGLGTIYIPFSKGASVVISEDDNLYHIFEIIEKYRVTTFLAVPSIYLSLLIQFPQDKNPFRFCRMCVAGGEPLQEYVATKWKEKTNIEIYQIYGSTELLNAIVTNRSGIIRYGSMGKPVPGYEAMIINEKGERVKPYEIGTLYVKGESTMIGYWKNTSLTNQVLTENGVCTGDMCYYDEEGYIWFAGRNSDTFKVNGVWQSALPIENALLEDVNIREAVVVNEVDNDSESIIAAYVVAVDFATGEETVKRVKELFFKKRMRNLCPNKFYFIEEMPRGTTGKVKRGNLDSAKIYSVLE